VLGQPSLVVHVRAEARGEHTAQPLPLVEARCSGEVGDLWRVTLLHALMHAGEIGWPQLLNSINVDYLTLHYDDVTMRLPQSVHRVADFAGIKLPDADLPAVPTLSRQADIATEQFVTEWRHETGGCPACADATEP
jgi:LPS sulfotransferase NodH